MCKSSVQLIKKIVYGFECINNMETLFECAKN